jgi:hypothetical protein
MGTLSTTAWVLHDLGLAAGFGGPLFGEVALHKAVKDIPEEERGRVLERAWNTYNIVDAACLGLAATTWLIGRSRLSGREIDRHSHSLVVAKDIIMSAALGTGLASFLIGRMLHEHKPGDVVQAQVGAQVGDGPSQTMRQLRSPENLKRMLQVLGPLNTALAGAALAITTVLAVRSGRSSRWSIVSRFLP